MNSNNGSGFLKDFMVFLQSLWGILAGISVFFPLSNVFSNIIPIGNFYDEQPGSGAFAYFNPEIIAATATLITLFVVLSTFIKRHKLKYKKLDFI